MSRSLVFGNGNILVCLDTYGRVRDFYYPYVGQENQSHERIHRIGIWVENQISWLDDAHWERKLLYKKETLVGDILARNSVLEIELNINDCVHFEKNVFIRKVKVTNLAARKREIRVFFHQSFALAESHIGDTVYYDPIINSIIHYKGTRYILMNGQFLDHETGENRGISSYAAGLSGEYGKLGTYIDAEDGILSNNSIEHGSVDSTIAFHVNIDVKQDQSIYYWVGAGRTFYEVSQLNSFVLEGTPQKLIDTTEKHWFKWVNKTKFKFEGLSEPVIDLFKRSLLIARTHVDNNGAIIASGDTDILYLKKDTYAYMWPRDGALIARSFDKAGYSDLTKRFFTFCCKRLVMGQHVPFDGFLFHKYRPDGSLGSSWHSWLKEGQFQLPIQEDQIALILDAILKHFEQNNNKDFIDSLLNCCIRAMADFLVKYIDNTTGLPKESYDLWEEKLGIHTFTCATIYAGLISAAKFELHYGDEERRQKYQRVAENLRENILKYLYDPELKRFIKRVFYEKGELKKDLTIDASTIYGIFNYGVLPVDDERVQSTIKITREKLLCSSVGGYARYEGDRYYHRGNPSPGNPWFITTLWFAEYYIARAKCREDLQDAIIIFEWVAKWAMPSGVLAEQIDQFTGEQVSVAPLTWSHAGFVIAIVKYLQKLDDLGICEMCNPPKLEIGEK